jgi:hypothetical protein
LDLSVRITRLRYPSHTEVVWLGSSHVMKCRMQVYDSANDALLGTADVASIVSPPGANGGFLGGGLIGVMTRAGPSMAPYSEFMLLQRMADEIVKVLDRSKE